MSLYRFIVTVPDVPLKPELDYGSKPPETARFKIENKRYADEISKELDHRFMLRTFRPACTS